MTYGAAAQGKIEAGEPADGLRIHLLGGLRVWVEARAIPEAAWRWRKAAHLVKLLALAPGHRLHREQVMDLLWPDLAPAAALNNLHQTLHLARRTLEPDSVLTGPAEHLRLLTDEVVLYPVSPLAIDVAAFEAAAAQARRTRQ